MQEMVGCDNNRTPVIFQSSDNCVFVGGHRAVQGDEIRLGVKVSIR